MLLENDYVMQTKNYSLNIWMCIDTHPSLYTRSILRVLEFHTLSSSGIQPVAFCPPGDNWQGLQTLFFVATGEREGTTGIKARNAA